MPFELSQRLQALPPYIFVELDRLREEAVRRGEDIINLGIGDPDQPTPSPIVDAFGSRRPQSREPQVSLQLGNVGVS